MKVIIIYLLYLGLSSWLTLKVGNSLHANGRHWIINLVEDVNLSDKLNNILLLGYRLVNIGYIIFTLMITSVELTSTQLIFEYLSMKLGIIVTILAYLHYQNILMIFIFSKLKHKYKWQI